MDYVLNHMTDSKIIIGHGDITCLPPLRSAVQNPGPYVRKLVVSYCWSAVYSTEP